MAPNPPTPENTGLRRLTTALDRLDACVAELQFFSDHEEWGGIDDKLREYNPIAIELRTAVLDLYRALGLKAGLEWGSDPKAATP